MKSIGRKRAGEGEVECFNRCAGVQSMVGSSSGRGLAISALIT
jgi:hypothetical protein